MGTKQKFAILFNLASAGVQIYASILLIMSRGWLAFQYYTMDSNIFAAITSILLIIALITKGKPSKLVNSLRYYSTCCVTVTFIVVITILLMLVRSQSSLSVSSSRLREHVVAHVAANITLHRLI